MGQSKFADYLINQGAVINVSDKIGDTPLHYAAEHGKIELMRSLIAKGADVNALNLQGKTPLHEVGRVHCYNDMSDHIALLLDSGSEMNILDKLGHPPVFYLVEKMREKIKRRFVDGGVDLTLKIGDKSLLEHFLGMKIKRKKENES